MERMLAEKVGNFVKSVRTYADIAGKMEEYYAMDTKQK